MSKNNIKKLVVTIVIAVSLLGSAQVYAASMNTNLFGFIKSRFMSMEKDIDQRIDNEVSQIALDGWEELAQHHDLISKNAIADIDAYLNAEVERAENEIDAYVEDGLKEQLDLEIETYVTGLKEQMDQVIEEEQDMLKQSITDRIDNEIENVKRSLDSNMEYYLNELSKLDQIYRIE